MRGQSSAGRRTVRRLGALAGGVLLLAACTSAPANPQSSAPPPPRELPRSIRAEITFESYRLSAPGPEADALRGIIADFMTEHPNITVRLRVPEPDDTVPGAASLAAAAADGDPPDVADVMMAGKFHAIDELGAVNLNKLFNGMGPVDDVLRGDYGIVEQARWLGFGVEDPYGLPFQISTPVLWYNRDALADAGLGTDVNLTTWQAVHETARVLSERAGRPALGITCLAAGPSPCLSGLIESAGGGLLAPGSQRLTFDSPETIAAVEQIAELNDDDVLATGNQTELLAGFAAGEFPLLLASSTAEPALFEAAQRQGWALANTRMPAFGHRPTSPTADASLLMMFAAERNKRSAAWMLIRYLTDSNTQEEFIVQLGYLPIRPGMLGEGQPLYTWGQENPYLQANLAQSAQMVAPPVYPGARFAQIDAVLDDAVREVVFGHAAAADRLSAAQREATRLIR